MRSVQDHLTLRGIEVLDSSHNTETTILQGIKHVKHVVHHRIFVIKHKKGHVASTSRQLCVNR